jgi:hypothetical protein
MIQAARHLAAFWPNQGADVIPIAKSKTSAGAQALGAGWGLGIARPLDMEPFSAHYWSRLRRRRKAPKTLTI